MKKLLTLVAIAAAIPLVAVESANVVGYTSTTCEAGKWYLIGCNFEAVSGSGVSIQDLVKGLTPGSDASDSPTIQYWDGSKLQTLCFLDFVWSDDAGDFVEAWADPLAGDMATFTVDPGFGCWIKLPSAGTFTCSGQVVAADETPKSVTINWQLMSNPYPVALSVNSAAFDCSELAPGSDASDSPTIQYWDGEKLQTLCYLDFVWSDDAGDFVYAWADPLAGDYSAVSFPPCTGFWIKGSAAGTITFKK